MIQDEYRKIKANVHKDGTSAMTRITDFLERFVVANEELIRDHDFKTKEGKKTRRKVPDQMFREATKLMGEIREIFSKVALKPISSR